MYQTGKQYNLDIDSYVDERSDPLKASEAAAQYMTNMYKIFGDWDLVLASYNSDQETSPKQSAVREANRITGTSVSICPTKLQAMFRLFGHDVYLRVPQRTRNRSRSRTGKAFPNRYHYDQKGNVVQADFRFAHMPIAQLQLLNPQFKRNVVPAYFDKKHF
jgi:membrane-bound lytic murein transglycosylase D